MKKNIYTILFLALAINVNLTYADTTGNPENIPGWVVVYESDAPDNVTRGSLKKLVKAIRSGADVKILLNNLQSIQCDSVIIFVLNVEEHVACDNFTNVALLDGLDPLHIRTAPYHGYQRFDTLHRNALARASIYGGANAGQTVSNYNASMKWFARVR